MFEDQEEKAQYGEMLAVVQGLPLVYTSLKKGHKENSWCKDLAKGLESGDPAMRKLKLHNKLLFYQPKGAKKKRYVVPELLRPMFVTCSHDSLLSGHLGAFKT
jgi:hypothetical protein